MGETDAEKSVKCDKASASRQEPTNSHQYPDWTTMQAYYGPGVPLAPSYMHPAAMAGHAPHPHAWAPYGMPYPAMYPPGVVYAHPAVPIVSAPGNTQVHPKPSDTTEQGSAKKLKKMDGAVMEVVNFSAQIVERQAPAASHSLEHGTESTDASSKGGEGYNRDERQLKRERRKQANRESARRSRMRKQAETEELLETYETLKVENINLTSEINLLKEESDKLRVENGELMEKLSGSDGTNPEILASVEQTLSYPSPAPEVFIQSQDLGLEIKAEEP